MSYGSEICPICHGELRVYFDGDGTCEGDCPTCGHHLVRAPKIIPSRIPDKGAFYEVVIDEWHFIDTGEISSGMKVVRSEKIKDDYSLAIYTNITDALKRAKEADVKYNGEIRIIPHIKKWNHARTEWEYWRPEHHKEAVA